MNRVLYIQNGELDHPGLFARVMKDLGVSLDVVQAWDGEAVPEHPAGWAGLCFGGGSMSAYEAEEYPFLRDESMLIREARAAKIPVLGLCLGAQLMAGACGGRVFANRQKEIGFYPLQFTPAAASDRLWRHCASGFSPVHWHGDTFSLPPGAVHLASSELTPHQLYSLDGRHYGLQFHLEIDQPVLKEMIDSDEIALRQEGVDPQEFRSRALAALPAVEPVARAVFTRWLEMLL